MKMIRTRYQNANIVTSSQCSVNTLKGVKQDIDNFNKDYVVKNITSIWLRLRTEIHPTNAGQTNGKSEQGIPVFSERDRCGIR